MTEPCEWNPKKERPADSASEENCRNEATVSTGSRPENNFHLCASCAERPFFRRMKKRSLARGGP